MRTAKTPKATRSTATPKATKGAAAELARVEPHSGAGLDAPGRKLVAEALRLAEETRDVMEDALVRFGRWLLVNVFDDDAAAALDDRRLNPVWSDLLARAGGPTLRLSPRLLYVALHIAARDKRITDEAWRALEPGRKQMLLPLGDEGLMREAAQHVTAMKLSQRATHAYVTALLAARGEGRKARVTAPRMAAQLRRFRERVAAPAFQRRAVAALRELPAEEAEPVVREVEAVRRWADEFLKKVRGRG
jgi:hypothetical protein